MTREIAGPALLALYLFVGALYAIYTPAWQAPDEPAHYNYIRQLANGRLPVIAPGDYDEAYQREVISARFAPGYSVEPFSYEDWQPPLYYLLLTPLYWAGDGALLPLRLASVLIGAGVVWFAYRVGRRLWPGRPWPALTAAAFVAFLPQHVAMLAAVNNDSLAELLIAALLYTTLAWLLAPGPLSDRRAYVVGVLLGLGFLTKGTVYLMAPVVALALLWRAGRDWPALWRAGGRVFAPALLLGALWWGRNALVYGPTDPLALAAHDAVVTGQLRTTDWLADLGPGAGAAQFARTTFQSFWGQFGWMAVPMPGWVYGPLVIFSLATLLGILLQIGRSTPDRRRSRGLLLVVGLLSVAVYLGYNVTFVQHQGRYLFPALIPIAAGVAAGWGFWARPFLARRPALGYLLPLGLTVALVGLDLLALFRFIVPNLTPSG